MAHKLGKKPATVDRRDLKLSKYLKLPPAPDRFGHATALRKNGWGMLGNDSYGDCVWAGAAHEHMLLTKLGSGKHIVFTPDDVLADYSDCTGFQPDDPQSDQGTDMRDAAKYRQKTGVVDRHGDRHKTGAYVWLDPGDWAQLRQALFYFEVVGIGAAVPESIFDEFDNGEDWDYVKGSPNAGGHYFPGIGAHDAGHVHVVTWGRRIQITQAFYEHYADEAVVYVSEEDLVVGKSPEGFDIAQLQADLKAL